MYMCVLLWLVLHILLSPLSAATSSFPHPHSYVFHPHLLYNALSLCILLSFAVILPVQVSAPIYPPHFSQLFCKSVHPAGYHTSMPLRCSSLPLHNPHSRVAPLAGCFCHIRMYLFDSCASSDTTLSCASCSLCAISILHLHSAALSRLWTCGITMYGKEVQDNPHEGNAKLNPDECNIHLLPTPRPSLSCRCLVLSTAFVYPSIDIDIAH